MTTYDRKIKLNNQNEFPVFGLGTYDLHDAAVIADSIKMGYRMLDTASFYKNEEIVGQGIRDSGVPREELYVISKVWWDEVEDVEAACRRSLERLGIEQLDLYLVHWPFAVRDTGAEDESKRYEKINLPMHKIWPQMEALVDKGLVKNIGVSNFNVQLLWDLLSYARIKPTFNEIELSPLCAQTTLLGYLKQQEIVPIAYCPLVRGNAESKCKDLWQTPLVQELTKKYNATASQILLAYGFSRGCVMIPKTSNRDRLKENAESMFIELTQDEIDSLSAMNENFRICDNFPWMLGTSIFA